MRSFLLVIAFLYSSFFSAQMLKNEDGRVLSEEPFFNEKFIKSVKLKSLVGSVSTKRELGSIKTSSKRNNFLFDKNGYLKAHYKTKISHNKRDTNFIFYEYNSNGNMMVKRYSDSYGFYSYSYKYNEDGLRSNQVYAREKNASKGKINFSVLERHVVFEESYKYLKKDTIIIKTVLNSNGRPYQEQISFYNSLGYLIKVNTKLLINNKRKTEIYQYNEKGYLKSINYFKESSTSPYKGIRYDYDALGNVTFIDEYKDSKRIIHKELLYEPSTLILKTILSQDLITNLITITKFKPKFYN